jgi:hypothetical protein
MIPDETNKGGVNPANIMRKYLRCLRDDLGSKITPESKLFWRGNGPSNNGEKSAFVDAPIGKGVLTGVPRWVAEYLGKEDPLLYSGHSMRRSSATNGANNLMKPHQLQVLLNYNCSYLAS